MIVAQSGGMRASSSVMRSLNELRELVHGYPTPIPYVWVPKGRGKMDAIAYRVMNRMIRCNKVELWRRINDGMRDMVLYGTDPGIQE